MKIMVNDSARALQPLLVVEDLERLLRVDRRTIARWCRDGRLPAPLKIGGGNRWRAEDIADVLNGLGTQSQRTSHEEVLMAAV